MRATFFPCSACRVTAGLSPSLPALTEQMAPYRESLSRLLAGTELSGPPYYLVTYGSLGLLYWIAM